MRNFTPRLAACVSGRYQTLRWAVMQEAAEGFHRFKAQLPLLQVALAERAAR